jgi:hypothetical protein
MSRYFIQIEPDNNKFIGHPQSEESLKKAYPHHSFEISGVPVSPPTGWVEFEFVEPPTLNTYQKFDETIGGDISHPYPHEGLEYRFANNKYTMFWHVLDMSAEEIAEKQQEVKDEWAAVVEGANPNPASWVFNEETCSFEPPIPYPSDSDGTVYSWNEETTSWIEFTEE